MVQQGIELAERPHVVIATPGRLADHISSGTNFSLKRIRFLVFIFSIVMLIRTVIFFGWCRTVLRVNLDKVLLWNEKLTSTVKLSLKGRHIFFHLNLPIKLEYLFRGDLLNMNANKMIRHVAHKAGVPAQVDARSFLFFLRNIRFRCGN